MDKWTCIECGSDKKSGYKDICDRCYHKKYIYPNKDKTKEYQKNFRMENKEYFKEYNHKYWLKRKEYIYKYRLKKREYFNRKQKEYIFKKNFLSNFFRIIEEPSLIYSLKKDKPKTREQREKIRDGVLKFWEENPNQKELARLRRFKQILPVKDTSIEIKIQYYLKELKIEFFTHQHIPIEHSYQCDIFIPIQKNVKQPIIIECDGDYWHGNNNTEFRNREFTNNVKKQIERDISRTKELEESGYKVIRLWESEIKNMKITDFQNKFIAKAGG